ncbi:MAG: hypothetical protein JWO80_3661 [Bryobacterales bacterium]|nr:hypothetical protein [Bryobacterales bacterium]
MPLISNTRLGAVFILLFASAGLSRAQEFRATLNGRVTDSQGAVVAGAKISVVNQESQARSETVTGSDGFYNIPFLAPAAYTISVESSGFKRYLREGVRLSINDRVTVDAVLEVGTINEQVTVSAEASLVQSATASTGEVIDAKQVADLPLSGRAALILSQVAYGVIPTGNIQFVRPYDASGPSGISMGGAPSQTNELLLDGAPVTTANLRAAYQPPLDAVEEVKVEVFQADAGYGHTGGGTINMISKGGTNGFHGTAYAFNQVSALGANLFFANSAGQPKAVTRYNQYGLTAGGPIFIPKVFDGRNRLFAYFAWEQIKAPALNSGTDTVPTAEERTGDFSKLLALGANYQIYDPQSGVSQAGRVQRQPFAGNIIPSSRLSAVAQKLQALYPLPNIPGRPDFGANYSVNTLQEDAYNNTLGRIDYNANDRNKFFFTFRQYNRNLLQNDDFPIADGNTLNRYGVGSTLDYIHTLNPTTFFDFRLNWTRFNEIRGVPSAGLSLATFGFPAALAAQTLFPTLPCITFKSYSYMGCNTAASNGPSPFDQYQIYLNVSKVLNRHALKAGADLRMGRQSATAYGNASGAYTFASDWTAGPFSNSGASPIGQDYAAFLLGLPSSGQFDLNTSYTIQSKYYGIFLQDDYRPTSTLTVNVGLRYEHDLPTNERFNRTVNGFDTTTPSPIAAAAQAAYANNPLSLLPASQFQVRGGLLFANSSNPDIYKTSGNFSPRLGLAWKPAALGGKTVVRAGVGMFYFDLGTFGINQPGFSQTTPYVATNDGFLTPAATLSNPFPALQHPQGSSQGLATYLGQSVSFVTPDQKNPYSFRYNLNIQHELPWDSVLEVGYAGNHAVHLAVNQNLNFIPNQYLSRSPVRDQPVINALTANVPNPFAGLLPGTTLNGTTVPASQLLEAFPQFTGVTAQSQNIGSTYFQMMQGRLRKRFSKGVQVLVNYQYSKLIAKTTRLNGGDTALVKDVSSDDRPQHIVASGSWDLPFGKGRLFGSQQSRIVDTFIGGWSVNGIFTMQVGAPLNWGNVIYLGGPLNNQPRNVSGVFDVTRFNRNSAQQLANNVRTFADAFSNLRQDGVNNVDFSALKQFRIAEKVSLQFRCEFFNLFNHPLFNAPNLTPTSSSFGLITSQSNLSRRTQLALRLVW